MAQPFEIFSPSLIRLYDKKKYTFPCNSNSLHLFISISLSLSLSLLCLIRFRQKDLHLSLIIVCANNSRRGFNCCWLVFPIFMKGALIFPSLYFMFANWMLIIHWLQNCHSLMWLILGYLGEYLKSRRRKLEEIIYSMIVQKFLDNVISMIPWILPTSDPTGRVGFRPNQEQKLEMIQSHLSIVLGERLVCPLETIVEISKVKLWKLYAASKMCGYFLRRVDQRYQLERTMNTLPKGFDKDRAWFEDPSPAKPTLASRIFDKDCAWW